MKRTDPRKQEDSDVCLCLSAREWEGNRCGGGNRQGAIGCRRGLANRQLTLCVVTTKNPGS
ncbi:hypothetical protein SAMN04487825_11068 [Prevotella sp. kh1p2]|nr:hypothetical protein SAMN04487825_11068 [Prevotella sp. kh1p2]SNU11534.1 hypothetical protein SAMN06298210_11167 [Prevotellaceae bacterium KH2P17]